MRDEDVLNVKIGFGLYNSTAPIVFLMFINIFF